MNETYRFQNSHTTVERDLRHVVSLDTPLTAYTNRQDKVVYIEEISPDSQIVHHVPDIRYNEYIKIRRDRPSVVMSYSRITDMYDTLRIDPKEL